MGYANGGVARRAGMRHKERQTDKPEPTTPKPEPVVAPTATLTPKPSPAPEPVTVTNPRPMTSDDPSQQLVPTDDLEVAKATGRPFTPFTTEGHSPEVVQTTKDLRDSQRASEQHFEQHFGAESRRRQKEYDDLKAKVDTATKEWIAQNPHDRKKEDYGDWAGRRDKALADKGLVLGRSKAGADDIVADGLVDKVHLTELKRLNDRVQYQYDVTRRVIQTDTAEHLLGAKVFDKPVMEFDYSGVRGADGLLPQKQRMDRDWMNETETSGPIYKPVYERVYIKPDGTEVASHARLFSDMSEHVDRRTYEQNVLRDTAKHRFEKITVLVTRQQMIDGDGDGKYNEAMKEQLRRQQAIVDSPNTHIVIHVPESAVGSIVSGGRFKSQLETGRSKGFKGKEFREGFEGSMVGVVHGDDKSKSVIYGALHTGGVQDSLAIAAEQYGRIGFVLKRSVHERSTFTDTDSLNSTSEASPLVGKQTTPNGHRHLGGVSSANPWRNDISAESKAEFDARLSRAPKQRESYKEAQVLGGVTLADIDHVTVPRGTKFPDTARRKLQKLGIPIVEYDVDGIAPPRAKDGSTIEDSGAYAFDPKGAWGPIPLPTAKQRWFVVDIWKHLAGQHDQQTHVGGHGHGRDLKEVAKKINEKTALLNAEGEIFVAGDFGDEDEDLQMAKESVQMLISQGAPNDSGMQMTTNALDKEGDSDIEEVLIATEQSGMIAGAVSISRKTPYGFDSSMGQEVDMDNAEDLMVDIPNMMTMGYLGTTGLVDGAGSALFGRVVKQAAKEKRGLFLEPLDKKARAFWTAMGFTDSITVGQKVVALDLALAMDAQAVADLAGLLT